MSLVVYVNGEYVAQEKARVSILDRGFLYGDGLFETLRAYGGRVFRLKQHWERLSRSADRLFLKLPEPLSRLKEIIEELIRRNQLSDAMVRIQVTRGEGALGPSIREPGPAGLVVQARPLQPLPQGWSRDGIKVTLFHSSASRISEIHHKVKATSYLSNILIRKLAEEQGFQEGIFLDDAGHVCEGAASNIFLVQDGILKTPPAGEFVLEGITRQVVLEAASELGIPFHERNLTAGDLYQADEVFLTNTGIEVLPVNQVDGVIIGLGGPGDITRALHRQYLKIVEAEK